MSADVTPKKTVRIPARFDGETIVYLAFAKKDKLLYVGIANDFFKRMGQHAAKSTWYPFAVRFEIEVYDTRHQASVREAYLVRYRRPQFNQMLQGPEKRQQQQADREWSARPGCRICDDPVAIGSDLCQWHINEAKRPPFVPSDGPSYGANGRRVIGTKPAGFDANKLLAYRKAKKQAQQAD